MTSRVIFPPALARAARATNPPILCATSMSSDGFLLDSVREGCSQLRQTSPPVVRKEIGVKTGDLQTQLEFQIGKQNDADRMEW